MVQSADERRAKNREYMRRRYAEKRDEILAQARARYQDPTSGYQERVAEQGKRYREENAAKIREQRKAYYLQKKQDDPDFLKKEWQKAKPRYQRYVEENRDRITARRSAYREANKEVIAEKSRAYYRANTELVKDRQKAYKQKNREALKVTRNDYLKRKYHSDPQFRLKALLRSRITKALKNGQKSGSAVKDLGCTLWEFKEHIERQFTDGMTWENYGDWHLDHIVPLTSFDLTDRPQFLSACHYTNYQPLWADDNVKKGAKVGWEPRRSGAPEGISRSDEHGRDHEWSDDRCRPQRKGGHSRRRSRPYSPVLPSDPHLRGRHT